MATNISGTVNSVHKVTANCYSIVINGVEFAAFSAWPAFKSVHSGLIGQHVVGTCDHHGDLRTLEVV